MSGRLLSGAFRAKTGDPQSKLVLIVMADAACDQGGKCTLTKKELASRCQMTASQLEKVVEALTVAQWISPVKVAMEAFEVNTHNEDLG